MSSRRCLWKTKGWIGLVLGLVLAGQSDSASAQCDPPLPPPPPPDDGGVVFYSLSGQTVQANASGSFTISNVSAPDSAPADFKGDDYLFLTAVKITSQQTTYAFGQIPFQITPGGTFFFETGKQAFSTFTTTPPLLPESITLEVDCASPQAPSPCGSTITPIGSNGQCPDTSPCYVPLKTTATRSDGFQVVTLASQWTTYRSSNTNIARVVPDDAMTPTAMLVEGVSPGVAFITATNGGATSVVKITVANPGDLISTTVEGFVRRMDSSPASGVGVTVKMDDGTPASNPVVSDATGFFSIGPVTLPADPSIGVGLPVFASATLTSNGGLIESGKSVSVTPVAGGTTDVGIITIVCDPPWSTAFDSTAFELVDLSGSVEINAFAVFDNGTGPALYVGGFFNRAGGVPANDIARWNGSAWESVGGGITPGSSGFLGTIHAMNVVDLQDSSGPALYIVGSFVLAGGVGATHVAKWDGTNWSALGGGVGRADFDDAFAVAGFDDGNGVALYVGGSFLSAGGEVENTGNCKPNSSVCVDAPNIARWDGSAWSAVGTGVNPGPVNALAVYDDDGPMGTNPPLLYIGGRFSLPPTGPTQFYNMATWDGVSLSGVGVNGLGGAGSDRITSLTVFDDGSGVGTALYAGGQFNNAENPGVTVTLANIARWNGTEWSALGSSLDNDVLALAGLDDGVSKILYASGQFKDVDGGGVPGLNRVARWNGTAWSPMGSGIESNGTALAVFDDGAGPALYVGGAVADGIDCAGSGGDVLLNTQGYVAKWDDPEWSVLGDGLNDEVQALVVHDDGSGAGLFAGGSFTPPKGPCDSNASRFPSNAVAKFDGTQWSSLGAGMDCTGLGCVASVHALAVFDEDGANPNTPRLFAGGTFTFAGGVPANNVARWDGSSWSAVGTVSGIVEALTVFDDDGAGPNPSALYAGGSFPDGIKLWDGTAWTTLGGGVTGCVFAEAVFNGELYIGGSFSDAGGVPGTGFLARWDGTAWSAVGSGISGSVYALTVFDDGTGPALYAGGSFIHADGNAVNRVARWDGTAWSRLDTGLGPTLTGTIRVDTLLGFNNGQGSFLYAGGDFTTAGGFVDSNGVCVPDSGCIPVNRLAKWNPALNQWSAVGVSNQPGADPGGGVDGTGSVAVRALAVFDDGLNGPALFAGGAFGNVGASVDSSGSCVSQNGCIPSSNIARLGCR